MTSRLLIQGGSFLLALVAGWVLPAVGMRMLVPGLEDEAPRVRNYRGVEVPTGLGVVWLIWAASVAVATLLVGVANWTMLRVTGGVWTLLWERAKGTVWVRGLLPWALVAVACALGMVDDAYGGADAKGFRGHLRELFRGRLTTGGLKLFGVGALAALAATTVPLRVAVRAQAVAAGAGTVAVTAQVVAVWALATLVIGLTVNLVNLLDLRPGRALKAYAAIAVPSALGTAGMSWYSARLVAGRLADVGRLEALGMAACLVVLVLGPVWAIWRYDLGERGMLGDAGANAAGALAGYLLACALPLWGLAAAAAVLLGLNLASEKWSFSQVIEGNRLLSWLDRLGRVQAQVAEEEPPAEAPAVPDDGADADTGEDG